MTQQLKDLATSDVVKQQVGGLSHTLQTRYSRGSSMHDAHTCQPATLQHTQRAGLHSLAHHTHCTVPSLPSG